MYKYTSLLSTLEGKLILTAIFLVVLWLLRFVVLKILNRRGTDIHRRIVNQQLSIYVSILIALSFIIPLWLHWFQTVFAVISVIAVAIVLVTKDLLVSLLAHAVIVWRGLFSVGDRIKIQEYVGNIVQIGPMYITLAEVGVDQNHGDTTGRIIKLPNSIVLTTPVINYSRGIAIIWSELSLNLTFASNWRKAKDILNDIGETHSAKVSETDIDDMLLAVGEAISIQSSPSTTMRLQNGKVVLILRYAYRIDSKAETEHKIWADILERFATEEDIQFSGE